MWEIYKGFLLKYCTVDESAVIKFPKYSIKQKHFNPFHILTLVTINYFFESQQGQNSYFISVLI